VIAFAAVGFAVGSLTGCGKGPVAGDVPHVVPSGGTITFEIFVQGQITPSQGDYFIAVNANTDPNTNVNSGAGEVPGEPFANEAQNGTFTHWDQEFVYGFDTIGQPNNFIYAYKVLSGIGTTGTTVTFVPIILNANDFQFLPQTSANGGTNNALSITLPISDISIRPSTQPGGGTITTPPAILIYLNYITTDTSHVPADALGCCGPSSTSFSLSIPLTQSGSFVNQLTTPPNKSGGPSNPNLYITGGEVLVTLPPP